MSEELKEAPSRWRQAQKIAAIVAVSWAIYMYVKNTMGPDKDLIINLENYVIPQGCSINGIDKEAELMIFIRELTINSIKNISPKCLVEKYKISSEVSAKYNFHAVRYLGRNYYRIGNFAININCNNSPCKTENGFYKGFGGTIEGDVK